MTERTLPIPAEHREFTVKVDGEPLGRGPQLLSVSVRKAVNRLTSARLVYLDGAASSSDFPLSNEETFVPGAAIEVLAGSTSEPEVLFTGIVVRQALKVRDHAAPQLIVECRHKATKLTVGRKNASFYDQTDGEVMTSLLDAAGIEADVEDTAVTHQQLVQYRSTDWDFLLARAQANGKLIFTNDDTVTVAAPAFDSEPVCALQFGATILELDAEIDARSQYSVVKTVSWDPAQQALVERDAADPGVEGPGNLTTVDLAAVAAIDSYDLRHTAMPDDEAQAWADAEWLASQMRRVRGRVKCEGMALVNPGDRVTIGGVGDRYSGDVFVTGVRQDYDLVHGWKTHVQFGEADDRAASLVPPAGGLQIGQVTSNEDPDGEDRVRVRLPMVNGADEGVWARMAAPDAGEERGFFFRPEIGDEVVVGFFDDDPRRAVVLGMLHSSAKPAHIKGADDNHEKGYQSRSKLKISINDDTKVLQIDTPAGNRVTLSEADRAIQIVDQNGNTFEMNADGITMESPGAISIKAGTELTLESGTAFGLKGGTSLKIEGASGAELSSPATTAVKGGVVQIN